MESKLKIDVDHKNNNAPVIRIIRRDNPNVDDQDVRDQLVGQFIEGFPHWNHRWAKIIYDGEYISTVAGVSNAYHYKVVPISDNDIEKEIKLMQAYLESRPKSNKG